MTTLVRTMQYVSCMVLSGALLLSGCGGNSSATNTDQNTNQTISESTTPNTNTANRGVLINSTFLNTTPLAALTAAANALDSQIAGILPLYDVNSYRLDYLTLDSTGQIVTASGLLSVPAKATAMPSPLLSFQHGTLFYNQETPSNDLSAANPTRLIASLGYISLAPDYVGYGISQGLLHPYLQAAPSAAAVNDFIQAAQTWLNVQNIPTNGQLFLTGYSEGGYVTLAAQREWEANGKAITSSVAGSGPYHIKATLNHALASGALSDKVAQRLGYRPTAQNAQLMAKQSSAKVNDLIIDAIFNDWLPDDSDIRFSSQFLQDYFNNNDAALEANSVYNWAAKAPIRLTHGRDDEVVSFDNAILTLTAMQQYNVDIALTECLAIPANHDQCIRPYTSFVVNHFSGIAQNL